MKYKEVLGEQSNLKYKMTVEQFFDTKFEFLEKYTPKLLLHFQEKKQQYQMGDEHLKKLIERADEELYSFITLEEIEKNNISEEKLYNAMIEIIDDQIAGNRKENEINRQFLESLNQF